MYRLCLPMLVLALSLAVGCGSRQGPGQATGNGVDKNKDGTGDARSEKDDELPAEQQGDPAKNKQELAKLRGTWVSRSVERSGRPLGDAQKWELVVPPFKDGFNLTDETGRKVSGSLKPAVTDQLNKLDLIPDGGLGDEVRRAIYTFDESTLKICMGPPGGRRPKSFGTNVQSREVLLVLERK